LLPAVLQIIPAFLSRKKLNPLLLIFVLLLGLALFGCAQTHKAANVPSSSAVRGDIQTAKVHIEQASAAVKAAGGNAAALDSLSDRMEHKTIIIDRWLETHP
jgi:hypothetical protein